MKARTLGAAAATAAVVGASMALPASASASDNNYRGTVSFPVAPVVGCDGGRSTVRKLMGVGFPGEPSRVDTLIGEMQVGVTPEQVTAVVAEVRTTQLRFGAGPLGDGLYRVMVPAAEVVEDRGSRVIEQGLPHELGGTVQLTYAPDGIVCTIDVPAPNAIRDG